MTRAFWDTNLFIYQWDRTSPFQAPVLALRKKMVSTGIELVTSTMTMGEIMVGPVSQGQHALAAQYKAALMQAATIVPFEEKAPDLFAIARAQYRVKQPDAIQLACAAAHGVELFITNDDRLQQVRLSGIHFIVSIQMALQLI